MRILVAHLSVCFAL